MFEAATGFTASENRCSGLNMKLLTARNQQDLDHIFDFVAGRLSKIGGVVTT